MEGVGREMAKREWILRSGEADGADTAFRKGAVSVNGATELYLPWKGFNGSLSSLYNLPKMREAESIAQKLHPYWERCSQGVRKLLARNVFQMLGRNLDTPSEIAIGWTTGSGGTAFAFAIAKAYGIPTLNIRTFEHELEGSDMPEAVALVMKEIEDLAYAPCMSMWR